MQEACHQVNGFGISSNWIYSMDTIRIDNEYKCKRLTDVNKQPHLDVCYRTIIKINFNMEGLW